MSLLCAVRHVHHIGHCSCDYEDCRFGKEILVGGGVFGNVARLRG
jgi:hypothetical protein